MTMVGIDLSGPRNSAETYLVSFEEKGNELHLQSVCAGADDEKILETILSLGTDQQITIGIDAPLSYNLSGGDRPSDKELRRIVKEKGGSAGIMPPTMMRMVYLTLRGVTLTRLFESFKSEYQIQIVEIHPGACMILHGADVKVVKAFKKDVDARKQLLHWLESKGIKGISDGELHADHYVAACAAAFGAWQWKLGKSTWKFAANPPHHPYDFAC
jgi:predicted nuclease with RNAse H fold